MHHTLPASAGHRPYLIASTPGHPRNVTRSRGRRHFIPFLSSTAPTHHPHGPKVGPGETVPVGPTHAVENVKRARASAPRQQAWFAERWARAARSRPALIPGSPFVPFFALRNSPYTVRAVTSSSSRSTSRRAAADPPGCWCRSGAAVVLRHENAVLRRQLRGRVRYGPADRLWFASLSSLIPRRRWAEVFPITPGTPLAWHRTLVAHRRDYSRQRHGPRAAAHAGRRQGPRTAPCPREQPIGPPPDSR